MKNLVGKSVSPELEDKMEKRQLVMVSKGERGFISIVAGEDTEYVQQAICPIISEGDVIGSVILLNMDSKKKMGEVEQKLVQSAGGFLGRQMEQ